MIAGMFQFALRATGHDQHLVEIIRRRHTNNHAKAMFRVGARFCQVSCSGRRDAKASL
jgi:hypothetical protein